MSNYPMYVDDLGHGQVSAQPPGLITNATTYGFAFDIDAAQAQKTVDYFLNAPAGGAVEYALLGESVLVTFMHAQKLSSLGQVVGWLPDSECAFWLPLIGRTRGGSERFLMWNPYLVIDNSEGEVTGREVWGFRKFLGTVTLPNQGEPSVFSATARIYTTFSENTEGVNATLVTLTQDGVFSTGELLWRNATEAFGALHDLWKGGQPELRAHGWQLVLNLAKHFIHVHPTMPMVNLKQFRDCADFTRACYQGIIESTCTIQKLHGGGLLAGKYKLHITPCASHRINDDLGLAQDAESRFASWISMDFTADAGVEVWKA